MRTDKNVAVKLRLRGKSYSEIQKELIGVSKSTLSGWLKDVVLSDESRVALARRASEKSFRGLLKKNKNQTALAIKRRNDIQTTAQSEIGNISMRDLSVVGLALYWAEGHKRVVVRNGRETTYHPVSLTNSDAKLVKIFLEFLRKVHGVPVHKIKANVRIFKHLNENEVLKYWSRELEIPLQNFTKTYIGTSLSSMGKRPFNRLPYGVIQIRISDTNLFHKIMGGIEGLKNKLPR